MSANAMNETTEAMAGLRLDGGQKKEVLSNQPSTVSPTSVDDSFSPTFATGFHEKTEKTDDSLPGDDSKVDSALKAEIQLRKKRKKLDNVLEKLSKNVEQMEIIDMPLQLDGVQLYQHQKEGISWLAMKEKSNNIPSFWKEEKIGDTVKWRCKITNLRTTVPPKPIRGSILADDMGLGKTLQTVGLLLSNPPKGQTYPYDKTNETTAPRCTLIVSPVSVMANWKIQINDFVNHGGADEVLKVDLFYGSAREEALLKAQTNDVDVLLTSYHQLVSEWKMQLEYQEKLEENDRRIEEGKRPKYKLQPRTFVFDVDFHRVVLDEAHEIRNQETTFFKAVSLLQAERKLCLTGTPFVNRPSDIGSLLSFLEVEPLCSQNRFEDLVTTPIKEQKEIGLARLRTTLAHVMLRRNKEQVGSTLDVPDKEVQVLTVALTDGHHKEILQAFFKTTRACIIGLLRMGARRKLGAIFGLLLRLRQACCHLELVPANRRALVLGVAESMKENGINDLSSPEGIVLLEKLVGALEGARAEEVVSESEDESILESDGEESECESECELDSDEDEDEASMPKCLICSDYLGEDTAIILSCDHVFCYECLDPDAGQFCPSCHEPYALSGLNQGITLGTPMKKTPAKKKRRAAPIEQEVIIEIEDDAERAPKIQALLDATDEMERDEKGIIFSQWTSFLDIIESELRSAGHTYTRIDGTMDAGGRIAAMEKFATKRCDSMKTPRFVLCSLRACGTGINLTRGNVVFMMDPWWNIAVEEQAMDRVHRIGQKRNVRVLRFVMKDSIEEGIVDIQKNKAALGKGSMQKLTQQERCKARLTFLRDLFGIGDEEVKWDTDFIDDDDDEWISEYEDDDDDDDIWI